MSSFGTSGSVQRILLMIAMEAEAKPLLDRLQLKEVKHIQALMPFAPCVMYEGPYTSPSGAHSSCELAVITNGKDARTGVDNVGTNASSLFAALAVQVFKPDLIINAGTAGGFKRVGAAIGDAFIVTKFCHHDRRIPIPGFVEYGKGDHSALATPAMVESLGFKTGVCTTGNSLDHTEMDDKLMLENDASVKDMEAAAIAWVAELAATPIVALKVVTDIVDGDRPTEEEFFENLAAASASLQLNIPKVIEFVTGKKLTEL